MAGTLAQYAVGSSMVMTLACGRTSRPTSSVCSAAAAPSRLICLSPPRTFAREPGSLRPTAAPPASIFSCQAAPEQAPATEKQRSLLCTKCDGNGAIVCSQCKGGGLNEQDHFGGRYKAGAMCWLCRGKRQILCGDCNGAGFLGGFLNTQDE